MKLYRPKIRSRHPSHDGLRSKYRKFKKFNKKSVIRFGSTTELRDTVSNGGGRVEINTVESVKNSANKFLMKRKFAENNVKTAKWWVFNETSEDNTIEELTFPLISKHIYGSRGTGNIKHDTEEELETWMEGRNLSNYIFEEFKNYVREYRLHVTKEGCFYACRKVLKRDTPQEHRWYRNDDYCNWIREDGDNQELFDKPINWNDIVEESVKALNAVGLDIGAVDVKVQSAYNSNEEKRENPKFFIIEINSAPSFGEITEQKYLTELTKLIEEK